MSEAHQAAQRIRDWFASSYDPEFFGQHTTLESDIQTLLAAFPDVITPPPAEDTVATESICCHKCNGKWMMILCPTCGNKRCPKATDHDLACTNSNEPGQPGSMYGLLYSSLGVAPADVRG